MIDNPKDLLIEQAAAAFRERNAWGRILPSSAWWDLAPEDREAVFTRQLESRLIERALRRDGLSCTVQAVMERLK
jgi:hypothetical protein